VVIQPFEKQPIHLSLEGDSMSSLEQLYRYRQSLADTAERISKYMVKVEMAIQTAEQQQEPQQRAQWLAAVRETKENQA
jgi:hypothetical protein